MYINEQKTIDVIYSLHLLHHMAICIMMALTSFLSWLFKIMRMITLLRKVNVVKDDFIYISEYEN